MVPPAPTSARAEAGNCGDRDGSEMDTFGVVEYPTPPVPPMEIRMIPFLPSDLINAVAAATKVRLRSLPMSPTKVLKALKTGNDGC